MSEELLGILIVLSLLAGAAFAARHVARRRSQQGRPMTRPGIFGVGAALAVLGFLAGALFGVLGAPDLLCTLVGWTAQVVTTWVLVRRLSPRPARAEPAPATPDMTAFASTLSPVPTKRVEPDPPPRPVVPEPVGGAIFLSYRRGSSSDVTGRIYDRLIQHFGVASVFKDVDSIPLGVDFREHLSGSIGQCRLVLAVVGADWARVREGKSQLYDVRDFVRIELESALQRRIPVVPVLVQGAAPPQEGDLPPELSTLAYRQAIAIRPDPDFHTDMTRLIKGIEQHLFR